MELWNYVFDKKDILKNVIGKTYTDIKNYIDSKEKSYCFNNYDDTDYKNNKSLFWSVCINEYNFYDKIIHSFKLVFMQDNCIRVEKRY